MNSIRTYLNIIRESEKGVVGHNQITKSGCDLTDFGRTGWKHFCQELGLKFSGRGSHGQFLWKNDNGLTVATGNNPTTGEYYDAARREPQKGYASYMGAKGPREEVARFEEAVRTYAIFCKSEDEFEDAYIGTE
jgi:hypothetical protein